MRGLWQRLRSWASRLSSDRPGAAGCWAVLPTAPLDHRLLVVDVVGPPDRIRELASRGIIPQRSVRLIRAAADGEVVVAVGDVRLALDADLARAIRVWPVDEAAAPPFRRLWQLQPGERAVVRGLAAGAPAYRGKLLAMGLLPGTVIEVIRTAPLGDPVELRVRGYALTLRRAEAAVLQLETTA